MGPKLSDEDFQEDKIDDLYRQADNLTYDEDYTYDEKYDLFDEVEDDYE